MSERYHFNVEEYPQLGYRRPGSWPSRPGLPPFLTPKYILHNEVRVWLVKNATEGKWKFHKRPGRLVFVLDDEAMAFKLGYL